MMLLVLIILPDFSVAYLAELTRPILKLLFLDFLIFHACGFLGLSSCSSIFLAGVSLAGSVFSTET